MWSRGPGPNFWVVFAARPAFGICRIADAETKTAWLDQPKPPRAAGSGQVVNPAEALASGIAIIEQELSPVPHMTVAENIYLGREPSARFGGIDFKKMILSMLRGHMMGENKARFGSAIEETEDCERQSLRSSHCT